MQIVVFKDSKLLSLHKRGVCIRCISFQRVEMHSNQVAELNIDEDSKSFPDEFLSFQFEWQYVYGIYISHAGIGLLKTVQTVKHKSFKLLFTCSE